MILIINLLGVWDRVRVGAMDKGLGQGYHEWEEGLVPRIHRMQVHLPLGLETTLEMVTVRVCIRVRVEVSVKFKVKVKARFKVGIGVWFVGKVKVTVTVRFRVRVRVW